MKLVKKDQIKNILREKKKRENYNNNDFLFLLKTCFKKNDLAYILRKFN